MKKLLILTGASKEVTLAHAQVLHEMYEFFEDNQDILIISPQEISIINEQRQKDKIEYDDGFYTTVKTFSRLKEEITKDHKIIIVFGTIDKADLGWYDAVIGCGYTYEDEKGNKRKAVADDSKELVDHPKSGIKLTTPSDAPALFYDLKELKYFIRKFVEVSQKELRDGV